MTESRHMQHHDRAQRALGHIALALVGVCAMVLTGCGLGTGATMHVPTEIAGPHFQGRVYGGQQPISGGTIKLYAAGATGYGSAYPYTTGDNLLGNNSVTTSATGAFNITGTYTCPSASTLVYIVATAGDTGSGNNPNIALMTALGACGNLTTSTFISINEATTVASVVAVAQFMNGPSQVGSTTGNVPGLLNAFADVNLLADTTSGLSPGPAAPAGMTVPTAEIYTLADILAACVNTAGGTYNDGSNCGRLFAYANPGGTSATAPTDTVTAMMNITQHPSAVNTAMLYGMVPPVSPFQPSLIAQPNDFTVAVTMTGAALNAPSALASDTAGNIYIANAAGNTVTKLSHTGTNLSGSGFTAGLATPSAIAVDSNNIVWVTNQGNNSVSRLNGSSGVPLATLSGGGLNLPRSIAFDSLGTAWIANGGNASVTLIDGTGATLTTVTPSGTTTPLAIGVEPH